MDAIMTGIEFFHKGGSIMYVLLLCSIFVVTIGIERAMYFSRMTQDAPLRGSFISAWRTMILRGRGNLPKIIAAHSPTSFSGR